MRRNLLIALSTAFVWLGPGLLLAASASAAGGQAAIADCQAHEKLTRSYPTSVLENALATMPSTVKEYTDCADVIQSQLLKQSGSHSGSVSSPGGSSSSSGGSFLPTPVIVVLVLLVLAAASFGAVAIRRRRDPPAQRPGAADPPV
jgi:hypothetical protein